MSSSYSETQYPGLVSRTKSVYEYPTDDDKGANEEVNEDE